MSFQKNEQSDFDFSVIDKKSTQQDKLNFSVESLLEEHQQSKNRRDQQQESDGNGEQIMMDEGQNVEVHNVNADKGSFLQDLQKLEDQLSFETQLYNVYHDQASMVNSLNPLTKSNIHAKSNSNLKTTKQQSNNQSIDDYGYLVIDFGSVNKRKKSSRLQDLSKITTKHDKLHSHQRTVSSHKLKLSSSGSSGLLGDASNSKVAAEKCIRSKSKAKSIQSMALGKLLSPPRIAKQKSSSKQKTVVKGIKTKQKTQGKQPTIRLQKSPNIIKTLSKSKSPSKQLITTKSSKNTNYSTTTVQSAKMSNKSYTKSTNRQGNAYSQYYGFQDIGDSQRLVMKSNCIYTKSEKYVKSPNTKKVVGTLKSNSKCKKTIHSPSPSNKDLTMRFKKKKTVQNV